MCDKRASGQEGAEKLSWALARTGEVLHLLLQRTDVLLVKYRTPSLVGELVEEHGLQLCVRLVVSGILDISWKLVGACYGLEIHLSRALPLEGPAHEAEPLEHGVGSLDSPERVQRDPTRQTVRSKLGEVPRDDHEHRG